MSAPPEDRLHELPFLTRRALARVVVAAASAPASDFAWLQAFLEDATGGTTPTPEGARDVLAMVKSLAGAVDVDVRRPPVFGGGR